MFDRTIAVNLRGHLLCTRAVVPHLVASGQGAIVFTSSGSAHGAEPTRPCYAMAKAGLNALMRHASTRLPFRNSAGRQPVIETSVVSARNALCSP